jgi:Outer membrane protein beta-barrel domain
LNTDSHLLMTIPYLSIANLGMPMKKLNILVLILLSVQLFAQDTPLKKEVANYVQREDKLILNFTSDNWSDLPSEFTSKPFRSRGFSFLLMNDRMNATGNYGVGLGLGFMSQNVHTNALVMDTTLNESSASLHKIPDSLNYDLNKLSLNFITAALELRFRTNLNSHGERFKFNFGIIAGILVQSHTKYEDDSGKFKTYHVKHLNNFQYGLSGRIGYDNYALMGYYSLANVFQDGEGPELTPYSLGISLTF